MLLIFEGDDGGGSVCWGYLGIPPTPELAERIGAYFKDQVTVEAALIFKGVAHEDLHTYMRGVGIEPHGSINELLPRLKAVPPLDGVE